MTSPNVTLEISWPSDLDIGAAAAFFRALAAGLVPGPVAFDLRSEGGKLHHYVTTGSSHLDSLRRSLRQTVPGVRLERRDALPLEVSHALRLKFSSRRRALRTDTPLEDSAAILHALASTRHGEVLHLQWLFGPRLRPVAVPNNFIDFKRTSTIPAMLRAPLEAPGRIDPEERLALKAKQSISGWRVAGRLGVTAGAPSRERQLLSHLLAALRVMESPALRLEARFTSTSKLTGRAVPLFWPSVLNEREALSVVGWPLGDVATPGLTRSRFALASAAPQLPKTGRVLGEVLGEEHKRPIALNLPDALRHLVILGPTGVGKSTLMGQLALSDAASGHGLIVVDSKRDLIDDICARLPEERLGDVVIMDPSDPTGSVGYNPLAASNEQAPLVADRLVNLYRQVYGDNLGPRSEDILHAGLLTLALHGHQTLAALPLLFSNPNFRRMMIRDLDDPLGLGSFWSWYEGVSEAERRMATAPIMNKLRAVLLRPSLRRSLGQAAPSFHVRQVFTERKILLINLAKGDLGPETAQWFGALLMNEVWQQALARASVPAAQRRPVMLHVDEFHEYLRLPTPLADVLVAARGYGLGLTLATQHLEQLTPDVRAAILGNAGSRTAFRLSDGDARVMARDASPLTPEDFAGLGAYEAYASLLAHGARTPYASIRTLPFGPMLRDPRSVREMSSRRWGRSNEEVDAELQQLVTAPQAAPADSPLGRRKRPGGNHA